MILGILLVGVGTGTGLACAAFALGYSAAAIMSLYVGSGLMAGTGVVAMAVLRDRFDPSLASRPGPQADRTANARLLAGPRPF